jgi:hypothetical protein
MLSLDAATAAAVDFTNAVAVAEHVVVSLAVAVVGAAKDVVGRRALEQRGGELREVVD